MLNGIEVRVPFCDTKVINFANSIPNGSPLIKDKYILKKNLDDFIDKNKKLGFTIPLFFMDYKKRNF